MRPAHPVPPSSDPHEAPAGNARAVVGLLLSLAALGVVVVATMTVIEANQPDDSCDGGRCGHGYVAIFTVLLAIPASTLLAAMGASTSQAGLSRAAVVGRGRLPALVGLIISSGLLLVALVILVVLLVALVR